MKTIVRNGLRYVAGALCLAAGIASGLYLRAEGQTPQDRARAEEIAALRPEEKRELQRKAERLSQLPPDEQDDLRQLHDQLAADPDREQLLAAMRDYYAWLTSLTPTQRGELLALRDDTEQRLAKVRQFVQEQDRRAPISREDRAAVAAWLEERIIARMGISTSPWERRDAEDRRRGILWTVIQRQGMQPVRLAMVAADDFADLETRLTPAAQRRLQNEPSVDGKRRLVWGWIMSGLHWRPGPWSRLAFPQDIDERELVRFFEEELTAEQRESLLQLPSEEKDKRLRMYYLQAKRPEWRPGPGQPPGGMPGGIREGIPAGPREGMPGGMRDGGPGGPVPGAGYRRPGNPGSPGKADGPPERRPADAGLPEDAPELDRRPGEASRPAEGARPGAGRRFGEGTRAFDRRDADRSRER